MHKIKSMVSKFILIGSITSALSVLLGAFGAHGLKEILSEDQLKIFHTGVEYQFYHSLALILLGILQVNYKSKITVLAGWLFMSGITLFSGSLYFLSIFNSLGWIGIITPIGGICFIAGWILFAVASIQIDNHSK